MFVWFYFSAMEISQTVLIVVIVSAIAVILVIVVVAVWFIAKNRYIPATILGLPSAAVCFCVTAMKWLRAFGVAPLCLSVIPPEVYLDNQP